LRAWCINKFRAADKPTRIYIHDGSNLAGHDAEVVEFPVCDQYTIQGDLFSRAILENRATPIPLNDAVKNMKVIDALFRSASQGRWEAI
jgi:predicted dehydrogenase